MVRKVDEDDRGCTCRCLTGKYIIFRHSSVFFECWTRMAGLAWNKMQTSMQRLFPQTSGHHVMGGLPRALTRKSNVEEAGECSGS